MEYLTMFISICISMVLLSLSNLYEIDKIKEELKNIRNEIESKGE